MSNVFSHLNGVAGTAIAAVLNSFWLALGVTALVWLALKFLARINAATRYVIWWAVLGVVLVLPLAPRLAELWHSREPARVAAAAPVSSPRVTLLPPVIEPGVVTVEQKRVGTWPLWALGLWTAILLFRLTQIGRSWIFLRGVKRRASIAPRGLPSCGVTRPVRLLLSSDVSSPMAIGFLKPAVILPEAVAGQLEERELDHVLLHELAHIARLDDWTNLAARLVGAACALHPVAVWILRQIEREREMACDDFVVTLTGAAQPYAESLARLSELRWAQRNDVLASGILGSGSKAGHRIEMLLRRGREFSPRVSLKRAAMVCLALLGFASASALAPRWIVFAQQPRMNFEVVSIKPGNPINRQVVIGALGPRGFTATNASLRMIIGFAYGLRNQQIFGGPGWVDSAKFDIQAKPDRAIPVPDWAASGQMELMVQSLLADRFKVAVHRETRDETVYDLVVDRGGVKLKETDAGPSDPPGLFGSLSSHLTGVAVQVGVLADALSQISGSAVVDKTGLPGKYDFTLTFTPETSAGTASGAPNGSSIFTALPAQLGLRLEPSRGPVDILVIDHAEKPDAN